MLKEKITSSLVDAMRSKDTVRVSTLRSIKTKIMELETAKNASELNDDGVVGAITNMVKQREDSIALFQKAGRVELVEKEQGEVEILKEFLPTQMSRHEVESAVSELITETGASSMKDMGKVVGAFKAKFPNRADGKVLAEVVKGGLS
jgi:uncharacterized protein